MHSWLESIHHDGSAAYVRPASHTLGGTATLRVRSAPGAPLDQVFVRICPDGEQVLLPLRRAERSAAAQWWEGEITLSMPRMGYRFWLLTAQGGWWLSANGVQRSTPTDATDFQLLADHAAPDWVRHSVFYQIFPDRFADGDPSNNVQTGEYQLGGRPVIARPWGAPPRSHQESGGVEFFGGDLQGIAQRLDYLEELGVNALYLNPIFSAPSNHKYDTADYDHVDPHFGGDAALAELRAALDERGMRLMLDIVLNHCGQTHHWFTAAQRDRNAPTADFFVWTNHPDEYESWLGHRSLPKLNYASAHLREAIYGADDSVIRRWLRPPARIDGWRLDVANMMARQGPTQLGHKIGRAVRRAVKATNPQAYLLGEHFYDGSSHLQGDELDASMNYRGFTFPTLQWLAGFDMAAVWGLGWADTSRLPTAALAEQWRAFLAAIPWEIALGQFNLLDSHDTPRLRTIVGGDERLHRLATTLLMTFPGVPCIYYGDEVGLEGGGDPFCRGCMPWDPADWNAGLREFYRGLIGLRRTSSALSEGGFQIVLAEGETIAYTRHSADETLLVVAQRSDGAWPAIPLHLAGLPDGATLSEVGGQRTAVIKDGLLTIAETAAGASIWRVG
jgi:alpha-glucosidase